MSSFDKEFKSTFSNEIKDSSTSTSSLSLKTDIITSFAAFTRPKTLLISAKGISIIRFPGPSSEREINIYNSPAGSLAYTSARAKRYSGDCVLSQPDRGELITTTYFFGPGRAPVLRHVQTDGEEIKISGKWTSRAQSFVAHRSGRLFEWVYVKEKTHAEAVKTTVLVLFEKVEHGDDRTIARLSRDDQTRAADSTKWSAGNGGELVIDEDACGGIDEALIVATCLVMLKKEIDRRRGCQMAVMAGVAGGAGA